jgi:hypothetical protein
MGNSLIDKRGIDTPIGIEAFKQAVSCVQDNGAAVGLHDHRISGHYGVEVIAIPSCPNEESSPNDQDVYAVPPINIESPVDQHAITQSHTAVYTHARLFPGRR